MTGDHPKYKFVDSLLILTKRKKINNISSLSPSVSATLLDVTLSVKRVNLWHTFVTKVIQMFYALGDWLLGWSRWKLLYSKLQAFSFFSSYASHLLYFLALKKTPLSSSCKAVDSLFNYSQWTVALTLLLKWKIASYENDKVSNRFLWRCETASITLQPC